MKVEHLSHNRSRSQGIKLVREGAQKSGRSGGVSAPIPRLSTPPPRTLACASACVRLRLLTQPRSLALAPGLARSAGVRLRSRKSPLFELPSEGFTIFDFFYFSQKSEDSMMGSRNYQAHEMCMEVHIPKSGSQRLVSECARGRVCARTTLFGRRSAFSLVQKQPKSQNFSPAVP